MKSPSKDMPSPMMTSFNFVNPESKDWDSNKKMKKLKRKNEADYNEPLVKKRWND